MIILGIKEPHATNETLGFLKAITVLNDNEWEAASPQNIPKYGEVFVYRNYKTIETNFRKNELLIAEVSELEEHRTGKCELKADGIDSRAISPEDDLVAIFKSYEVLGNQEHFNIESYIRPPIFSFIETEINDKMVLVGPMRLSSSSYNEVTEMYESRLNTVNTNSYMYKDLKPYHAYIIPKESLPNHIIQDSQFTFNAGIKVAAGLFNFIKTASVEQRGFISDRELITILDTVLNPNSKLGRKGKRNLILEIEAKKNINPTMKPAIINLLEKIDTLDDETEKTLKGIVQEYANKSIINNSEANSRSQEQDDEINELVKKLAVAKDELNIVTKDNEKLADENETYKKTASLDSQKEIDTLKLELNTYKENEVYLSTIEEQENRKKLLSLNIEDLEHKQLGLSDAVSSLKSDLELNTNQFRNKALNVLPFFEIMNNVRTLKSDESDFIKIDQNNMYTPESISNLIIELKDRVIKQGYQAEDIWLQLVAALYLGNKFIGYFGSPGTGKTTLANCFRKAFGPDEISSELVKVGRGWTSFVDFIGYDNSFTGEFKYKNHFFKQFEKKEIHNNIFHSILFDEATLSSPEFYLSDFITETDQKTISDIEKINLDGHYLYLPYDNKIVLTFNVDETTEQLSNRFLSRMPVIYLTSNDDFDTSKEVNYRSFQAIDREKVNYLLKEELSDDQKTTYEKIYDTYDKRYSSYWKKLIGGDPSTRKLIQLEQFMKISSYIDNVDPSVVVDFLEEVFLMPFIKGDGIEYLEVLDEILPKVESTKAKRRIANILSKGKKYNIFSHI